MEKSIDPADFESVDKLFQWLDTPFYVQLWAQIMGAKPAPQRPLRAYVNRLETTPTKYNRNVSWGKVNDAWREAEKQGVLEEQIEVLNSKKLQELESKWTGGVERTMEDYQYLEDLYQGILKTQNVITTIQQFQARQFCEAMLNATKKIRTGQDAKDDMRVCHDIMKANGFEPKNAKNLADFDSVGDLFAFLEKRGWKPDWAHPSNDEVDLLMQNNQQYLRRLVMGAGNLTEQLETKKRALEVSQALENDYTDDTQLKRYEEHAIEGEIEYEGEDELAREMSIDAKTDFRN